MLVAEAGSPVEPSPLEESMVAAEIGSRDFFYVHDLLVFSFLFRFRYHSVRYEVCTRGNVVCQ